MCAVIRKRKFPGNYRLREVPRFQHLRRKRWLAAAGTRADSMMYPRIFSVANVTRTLREHKGHGRIGLPMEILHANCRADPDPTHPHPPD